MCVDIYPGPNSDPWIGWSGGSGGPVDIESASYMHILPGPNPVALITLCTIRCDNDKGNLNTYTKLLIIMDACLTPEHSLLGRQHAVSPITSSHGETNRTSYPDHGYWNHFKMTGQNADRNYIGSCTFCGMSDVETL